VHHFKSGIGTFDEELSLINELVKLSIGIVVESPFVNAAALPCSGNIF
jgi:hypothetical protein